MEGDSGAQGDGLAGAVEIVWGVWVMGGLGCGKWAVMRCEE